MKRDNILSIKRHSAIYLGELGPTQMHRHGAPVLLIGLSGRIRIQLAEGPSVDCHNALIDAEVAHRLDPQGERLASIYCEVHSAEAQWLRATWLRGSPAVFDLIPPSRYRHGREQPILNLELDRLLDSGWTPGNFRLDHRVSRCIEMLNTPDLFSERQARLAEQVHLSPSRLNHLFKQSTGVSYRRYRLWSQLLHFMRDVSRSNDLTRSALDSGFSDAAHLSNSYRKVLGISPAALLRGLDRFEVDGV